ncbi:hypothetical protein JZ751_013280 [Albula glossodonta]|uniref:Immunoglobulin V-set domain-containing protein n=1 Tax=Albula glossodonta TaxID=121402 RepID=A0A8T2NSI4_9TELE|nr:hypothetical protein JZ751_013280 [Albula glossodonta]
MRCMLIFKSFSPCYDSIHTLANVSVGNVMKVGIQVARTFSFLPGLLIVTSVGFAIGHGVTARECTPASQNTSLVYFNKLEMKSVKIFCAADARVNSSPTGLYLKRRYPLPEADVLFLNTDGQVEEHCAYSGRLRVHGQLGEHRVKLSITQPRKTDSGLYFCEFIYKSDRPYQSEDFLLLIEEGGGSCICTSYSILLYTLSAAVGLLLLVIAGLGAAHYGEICKCRKTSTPESIYEEMTGLRTAGGAGAAPRHHLDPTPKNGTLHA